MTDTDIDLGKFVEDEPSDGEKSDLDRLIDSTDDDLGGSSESASEKEPTKTAQDDSQTSDQTATGQQSPGQQPEGHPENQQGQEGQGQGNTGAQDLTLKDGSVIKGGATRRIYERGLENERLRPQLQSIAQERDQLKTRVEAYENAFNTAKASGLSPQESTWAHQIVAAFKQDPVKTLQHLVAQTKAAGYNTEQLAQGVDANALRQMLQNELGPMRQTWEQEQQQRQLQQQGERMYNEFIQQFPEASKHEDEIAQLMEHGLEPQAAYYALRSAYLERGLDFNLSLQENAQRKATQQGGNAQRQPVPHGRGNVVSNPPSEHTAPMASENDSWDAIIRGVMP